MTGSVGEGTLLHFAIESAVCEKGTCPNVKKKTCSTFHVTTTIGFSKYKMLCVSRKFSMELV
jgi:hypothetical protein